MERPFIVHIAISHGSHSTRFWIVSPFNTIHISSSILSPSSIDDSLGSSYFESKSSTQLSSNHCRISHETTRSLLMRAAFVRYLTQVNADFKCRFQAKSRFLHNPRVDPSNFWYLKTVLLCPWKLISWCLVKQTIIDLVSAILIWSCRDL